MLISRWSLYPGRHQPNVSWLIAAAFLLKSDIAYTNRLRFAKSV
jgi:hypothetical protein